MNPAGDWGPRAPATNAISLGERGLFWFENGRFATVTVSDVWTLWDLDVGRVQRVEYTRDGLPTPDGAWLVGGRRRVNPHDDTGPLSIRFDPSVLPSGPRVAELREWLVEWTAAQATLTYAGRPRPTTSEWPRLGDCLYAGARAACIGPKWVNLSDAEGSVARWHRSTFGRDPVQLQLAADGDVLVWLDEALREPWRIQGWHRDGGKWAVEQVGTVFSLSPDGRVLVVARGEGVALYDTRDGRRLD